MTYVNNDVDDSIDIDDDFFGAVVDAAAGPPCPIEVSAVEPICYFHRNVGDTLIDGGRTVSLFPPVSEDALLNIHRYNVTLPLESSDAAGSQESCETGGKGLEKQALSNCVSFPPLRQRLDRGKRLFYRAYEWVLRIRDNLLVRCFVSDVILFACELTCDQDVLSGWGFSSLNRMLCSGLSPQ